MMLSPQEPTATTTPTNAAAAVVVGGGGGFWKHAKSVGKRASMTGQKAKLRADVLWLDQKIKHRKGQFGTELYQLLAPQAEQDDYFMLQLDENSNHALTHIAGHFITVFKDNKALQQKKAVLEDKLSHQADKRAKLSSRHNGTLSFDVPADTVGERILNAPQAARIRGSEAKLKTSRAVMDREMHANIQKFGFECYHILLDLELHQDWLPTDEEVRALYESARKDIARIEMDKSEKYEDLDDLHP